jgi:hypothetical protein
MLWPQTLITVDDRGEEVVQEIAVLERSEATLATLGLTLAESKAIVHGLQERVVKQQVADHLERQRPCPHCRECRASKENAVAPFRTLFGKVTVPNPRWEHCSCQPQEQKTFRPLASLLPERTSPELLYLETKWAALVPYGVTAQLLHEVLPIDAKHSAVTVRHHLQRVAERREEALGEEQPFFAAGCQRERDRLPIPDGPLTVGLDGGYVRVRATAEPKAAAGQPGVKPSGWFEVIAGKSMLAFRRADPETEPAAKCFGMVQGYDQKPKRRLFEVL